MTRKISKRFEKASDGLDPLKLHTVDEAVKVAKNGATTKFDETVDLALSLNIDTKQADQLVRGSFSLPNGTGKSVRVIAFCEGEEAEAATANGAIEVGGQDLVQKIEKGWLDFDIAICHPAMMRFVGKLGKVLGPKGMMPSPKSGTVTDKVSQAVSDFSSGKIEFRNDKEGNVHMIVGKASFDEAKLADNINAAINHIKSLRPAVVKSDFIKNITISTTMGPGVKIAL